MISSMNWGATARERAADLPCDKLVDTRERADRAITIAAPPGLVFAWLCQLRVAPYSYDLLDNLGRRSPARRSPELTDLSVGQSFMTMFSLASFEPDRHITLVSGDRVAVTYAVRPEGDGTRLTVGVAFGGPRFLVRALSLGDTVMMRKQLQNLKAHAEREARMINGDSFMAAE